MTDELAERVPQMLRGDLGDTASPVRVPLLALDAYRRKVAEDLVYMAGGLDKLDAAIPGWHMCLGGRAWAEFVGVLSEGE